MPRRDGARPPQATHSADRATALGDVRDETWLTFSGPRGYSQAYGAITGVHVERAHEAYPDISDAVPTAVDRFTGCLLGMAIGDALGVAGAGRSRAEVAATFGTLSGYQPLRDADGMLLSAAGQMSDNSELALCLVESMATSGGFVDPLTAGFRFTRLLHGDHAHFLGATTRTALIHAEESGDYQSGLGGEVTAGVGAAARVAPVGLVHALGRFNPELLTREVLRACLITHAHPEAINGALAIAYAVDRLVRRETPPDMLVSDVLAFIDEDRVAGQLRVAERMLRAGSPRDDDAALERIGTSGYVAEAVAAALYLVAAHDGDFEQATLAAANAGGASDAIGAMVGALTGAWVGAQRLPSALVEGLESRMYVLMAAPALFRTAQRRAGLFLQLHQRP
jgi:ADP-ribosyl-[dinitrogen reductase] hydrolase